VFFYFLFWTKFLAGKGKPGSQDSFLFPFLEGDPSWSGLILFFFSFLKDVFVFFVLTSEKLSFSTWTRTQTEVCFFFFFR